MRQTRHRTLHTRTATHTIDTLEFVVVFAVIGVFAGTAATPTHWQTHTRRMWMFCSCFSSCCLKNELHYRTHNVVDGDFVIAFTVVVVVVAVASVVVAADTGAVALAGCRFWL